MLHWARNVIIRDAFWQKKLIYASLEYYQSAVFRFRFDGFTERTSNNCMLDIVYYSTGSLHI
jgi:hypothetical protein